MSVKEVGQEIGCFQECPRQGFSRKSNRMNVFTRLECARSGEIYAKEGANWVGVVRVGRFDASAGDESAEGIFAAGAALGSDNEAVAVDDHVNGIGIGLIHGGEIGVFHHDDFAVARMLLEIFFDGFPGFADVDGKEEEAFGGEFMADLVDEGGFVGAEATPGGPEFEKDDFAFDGFVAEFLAGGGDGVEARGGLFVLGGG